MQVVYFMQLTISCRAFIDCRRKTGPRSLGDYLLHLLAGLHKWYRCTISLGALEHFVVRCTCVGSVS